MAINSMLKSKADAKAELVFQLSCRKDWNKGDKDNDKKNKGLPQNIIQLKKKLRHLITKYRIDHIHGKHQTHKQKTAYKLANNLYIKYQADKNKKDGLTLHEIEVLNKFWTERNL